MTVTITVMTYNVHSCIGRNSRACPSKTAGVIASYNPDIIALQELDMGLFRSGLMDQAAVIAEQLKMNYHFHPSIKVEQGEYGNAILSKYPLRLIKADELPTLHDKKDLEKRGAIWAEISIDNYKIQIINTHLGLNKKERLIQTDTLLSTDWLNHPACKPPLIFCGDLNSTPSSKIYNKIKGVLVDVQQRKNCHPRNTWPSWFPFRRIDYIFVSRDITVNKFLVPRRLSIRLASDHLPLLAELRISSRKNSQ